MLTPGAMSSGDTDELRDRTAEARAKAAALVAESRAIRELNKRLIDEARRVKGMCNPMPG